MSNQSGYCPWCQAELDIEEIEAHSRNIIWSRCKTFRCKGMRENVKSDPEGWVLDPLFVRGRYMYSKWCND